MPDQQWLQLPQGGKHPYTIIRSNRAKYIRVKLSNKGDLSLIIPSGASINRGLNFMQKKAAWIEKHLDEIDLRPEELPRFLNLKLLNEKWQIVYSKKEGAHLSLNEEAQYCLKICGDFHDIAFTKKLIGKWLQRKAQTIFKQMLDEISTQHGFNYNKLSIRTQKTRWGSCSQDQNISLNSKLLFFKQDIVRYVMVHELCHTIEMNHSKRFWHLVEACIPDYARAQKELKQFGSSISL